MYTETGGTELRALPPTEKSLYLAERENGWAGQRLDSPYDVIVHPYNL